MDEWLVNLKVGDTVIVSTPQGYRDCLTRSSVKRLTKTLIFTEDGMKFRRRTGCNPGDWAASFLLEPTPENMERLRDSVLKNRQIGLARKLRKYAWHKLSLETLQGVEKLLGETQ